MESVLREGDSYGTNAAKVDDLRQADGGPSDEQAKDPAQVGEDIGDAVQPTARQRERSIRLHGYQQLGVVEAEMVGS